MATAKLQRSIFLKAIPKDVSNNIKNLNNNLYNYKNTTKIYLISMPNQFKAFALPFQNSLATKYKQKFKNNKKKMFTFSPLPQGTSKQEDEYIWRDTVPTAKLTFRLAHGPLKICCLKADMRHNICGNSNVCPISRYLSPFARHSQSKCS